MAGLLQDPNNGIQYFTYDKNNRLVSSAKPMGVVTTYEYGATGNKTAVADPKGQRIEYTWSSENRLTQTRYFSADDHDAPVETINFTYDSLGNLLTWNSGTESAQYTYDDLGRKRTETVNYGSFSLSHAYTYTASGEIKTFTGPDGKALTYDYDTGARLAGITIPGAGQTGFSHDATAWNNPVSMTLPGGARQDYAYDPLMRLNTITASDPGSNPVMTRGYTYDAQGNITTKATEHGDYTYTYDTMDRLATAINPTLPDESYTYDNLGNRITDVKIQGQITYNADNQLESYGSTSYDYDDNGNMARKTYGSETTSFFYNIEDRLEKVENSAGDTVATYGYDPFGRRLWKQVSGTKTYFHYSNEGLIGEYNAQGHELKTYGYKPGSQWTTDPLFMKIGADYYWYQNDANGTPQKLIASNGLVVWEGRYDSFGNCQVVNNGITNNLRFAGQYYDAETGLNYNLNRYYDPQTGRYLRQDPFGDGLNLYSYCFNNPNGLIDPLGLCAAKYFFTLQGQANFWAGFGDILTSGFGLSYLFGIPSFTEWARMQTGSNDVVQQDSPLYFVGSFVGDTVGMALGEAAVAKIISKVGPSIKGFTKVILRDEGGWIHNPFSNASKSVTPKKTAVVIGERMKRVGVAAEDLAKKGYDVKTYNPRNFRSTPGNLNTRCSSFLNLTAKQSLIRIRLLFFGIAPKMEMASFEEKYGCSYVL